MWNSWFGKPEQTPSFVSRDELTALVLTMRKKRNLEAQRLQAELIRLHLIHLSTATLHKVLSEASVKPIVTYRCAEDFQRYERSIPVDRVQMDTYKIGMEFIRTQLLMTALAIGF